ncbi:MAG: glycosyltransferase family 4 protein [Candidatus Sumerlaeaceae bacterium]
MSRTRPKKVLIAQLNCVRSYRVRFYELLEERRPQTWQFEVVHDYEPERAKRLYPVVVDPSSLKFRTLPVKTFFLSRKRSDIVWQNFFLKARNYELIITDTTVSNLTYFAVNAWLALGVKRGFWGHTGDLTADLKGRSGSKLKQVIEKNRRKILRLADVVFAYTEEQREGFLEIGVAPHRVVTLHNTIDIVSERNAFERLKSAREELRRKHEVAGREVVIYLGRLLPEKLLERAIEAFRILSQTRPRALLVIVGDGPHRKTLETLAASLTPEHVRFLDAVDEEIAQELLACADLFCLPGQTGLAPLRALCFDLPVVTFQHRSNTPESAYLTPRNTVFLPPSVSAKEFAETLSRAFDDWKEPERRKQLYPTIAHLTMENMVDNFIKGINLALNV